MKNTIQLNIGTARNDGREPNSIPETAQTLRKFGFILTAARVVTGTWQGEPEETLACEVLPALPICHHECRLAVSVAVGHLARELAQSCIALRWPHGGGELCPPVSGQDFAREDFHAPHAPHVNATLERVRVALNVAADTAEDDGEPLVRDNLQFCADMFSTHAERIQTAFERQRAFSAPAPEITSGW